LILSAWAAEMPPMIDASTKTARVHPNFIITGPRLHGPATRGRSHILGPR
jgi:hypothetical protein